MKKTLNLILVALVGGLVAVAAYKTLEKKSRSSAAVFPDNSVFYRTSLPSGPPVNGPDFVFAAEKSVHAVVHIKTEYQQKTTLYDYFFRDFWGNYGGSGKPYVATGSGVIISSDGYVVTNNHVVQDADYIEVTLNDKRSFQARIIGEDASTDLALIKIDEEGLPFLSFGSSDAVRVGEWVLAVGNPFNLTSTVTAGIVSAKARNINILGKQGAIESFIQTDAAVNPGNSGGALVNTQGELIGINAAIASNTGSYTGYSFAIPSNLAVKVVEDLRDHGIVQRGYMGITPVDINAETVKEFNLDGIKGVYVYDVTEDGSAREAGIGKGDVITQINDIPVNSVSEMLEIVGRYRPGDRINLSYVRQGKEKNVTLPLKNKEGNFDLVTKEQRDVLEALGARFSALNSEEKRYLRLDAGVKVNELKEGLLTQAGVRKNFIITAIDKNPVRKPEDIEKILGNKQGGVLVEGVYPNRMRAYYLIVLKD